MNESNSIYSSKWFTVMKIFHDDSSSVVIMTHEEVVVFFVEFRCLECILERVHRVVYLSRRALFC